MPDISPTTIKEAYRQMFAKDNAFSLDGSADEDMKFDLPFHETPETMYFEKEENEILYNTIDSALNELEKCVVILSYGLFKSDINFLTEIMQNNAKYSDIELFKANGYTGAALLQYLGFSFPEIMQFSGIDKNDAEKAYHILLNGGSEEELNFAVEIQSKIQGKENQEALSKMNVEDLVEFMKKLGYSKEQIEAKPLLFKNKLSLLKKPNQIHLDALLKAKGFNEKEIEKIYTGKKVSQAKICILLGAGAQEVKNAASNAEHKLKKALSVVFPERCVSNTLYRNMLNEESLPTIREAERYAEAFLEQFEELDF